VPSKAETYLRVDREGPKVLVWVEAAGWWCLSLFLVRRVTPPSGPGMTPIACCRAVSTMDRFFCLCVVSIYGSPDVYGVVGSVRGNVPCWQWIPHSASHQPIAPNSHSEKHTLRLYKFLRFNGSRENETPFALLTRVALCPSVHQNQPSIAIPNPPIQCPLTCDLPRKVSGNSGGHFK
jgi:hypothetical protein